MRNSKIAFHNDSLHHLLTQSLSAFTQPSGLSGSKYDPKLIYDPLEDRFIIVILSGYSYTNSNILICFSESSNPMGNWHFYSVEGNFLQDSTWSDYPSLAINENELFITFTNFADQTSSDTWDFYGSRVIQMNKFDGYNGEDSIGFAYHLVNQGFGATLPSTIYYYNVIPVKGGTAPYGPEMYFLSTLDCPFPDTATNSFPPQVHCFF